MAHTLTALYMCWISLFAFYSAVYSVEKKINLCWALAANVVALVAPLLIYDLLF
jgi:hypothetical protein